MRNKIEKSPVRESLFKRVFGRLAKEEDGFAMEWVIIVLLVAAGVIAVVMVFSDTLRGMLGLATEAVAAGDVNTVEKLGGKKKKLETTTGTNVEGAIKAGEKVGGTGNSGNNAPATPPVPES